MHLIAPVYSLFDAPNRMVDETSVFVGKRIDTLGRDGRSWKIARREIYLDQSVMLAKNFTNFF